MGNIAVEYMSQLFPSGSIAGMMATWKSQEIMPPLPPDMGEAGNKTRDGENRAEDWVGTSMLGAKQPTSEAVAVSFYFHRIVSSRIVS